MIFKGYDQGVKISLVIPYPYMTPTVAMKVNKGK